MERTSACLYAAILALLAYCWRYEPQQPGKVVDETWQHALSEVKYKLHSSDLVNCTTLEEVEGLEFLASGWTKSVYKAMFRGRQVAVKTVNLNGQDMRTCLEEPTGSLGSCYRRTAVKILKELILLTQLRHRNVIEVCPNRFVHHPFDLITHCLNYNVE